MFSVTEQGVYRLSREPKNRKEALLALEKWTGVKETFSF
jgi:hypothetical protein